MNFYARIIIFLVYVSFLFLIKPKKKMISGKIDMRVDLNLLLKQMVFDKYYCREIFIFTLVKIFSS